MSNSHSSSIGNPIELNSTTSYYPKFPGKLPGEEATNIISLTNRINAIKAAARAVALRNGKTIDQENHPVKQNQPRQSIDGTTVSLAVSDTGNHVQTSRSSRIGETSSDGSNIVSQLMLRQPITPSSSLLTQPSNNVFLPSGVTTPVPILSNLADSSQKETKTRSADEINSIKAVEKQMLLIQQLRATLAAKQAAAKKAAAKHNQTTDEGDKQTTEWPSNDQVSSHLGQQAETIVAAASKPQTVSSNTYSITAASMKTRMPIESVGEKRKTSSLLNSPVGRDSTSKNPVTPQFFSDVNPSSSTLHSLPPAKPEFSSSFSAALTPVGMAGILPKTEFDDDLELSDEDVDNSPRLMGFNIPQPLPLPTQLLPTTTLSKSGKNECDSKSVKSSVSVGSSASSSKRRRKGEAVMAWVGTIESWILEHEMHCLE